MLTPGRRQRTLLPGMLFPRGQAAAMDRRGIDGRRHINRKIHAQLVSALVDGGADIATAVAAPRITVEPDSWFGPPITVLTDGPLAPGVGELASLGHAVEAVPYRAAPAEARGRARRWRASRAGRSPPSPIRAAPGSPPSVRGLARQIDLAILAR
ncbi:MAG: hypothetical protein U0838_09010 [Chloroflexota bacterium]